MNCHQNEPTTSYQLLIGILRWAVELGHVDIITEVSMLLSSHLALPREGHLGAVFYIFAYTKKKHTVTGHRI
jgi:N-acyl-L-homoserine lactone synthetase